MVIITYDTDRFDFRTLAEQACGPLDRLEWDGGDRTVNSDQQTPWHRALYQLYDDTDWLATWQRFARDWIGPLFGDGLAYQARPTWRVHPAGNHAIGPHHTDTLYGHGPGTMNPWVPLTDTDRSNTLWVDGEPMLVRYGQVLAFDGVNLTHGNVPNLSDRSRVSFDARVVPVDALTGGESFNTRTPLTVGGYYDLVDALALPSTSSAGSMPYSRANSASSRSA